MPARLTLQYNGRKSLRTIVAGGPSAATCLISPLRGYRPESRQRPHNYGGGFDPISAIPARCSEADYAYCFNVLYLCTGTQASYLLKRAARACPPPMHMVTTPYSKPRRCRSLAARSARMAPVAPSGWPRAMAPP